MIDARRLPGYARRRRGAAAVEFAVCAPVLFMLVFAIVEFSRATQLQQSVRQAAFEGARAGVALDASTSDVTGAAAANLAAVGIADPTISVSPSPLSYNSPTITVTVSATPATSGWLLHFFNRTSSITSTITLIREVQAISAPGSSVAGGASSANPPSSGSSGSSGSNSGSSGSGSSGSGSSGSGSSGSGSSGSGSSGSGSSGSGSSGSGGSDGWGGWGGGGWW